VLSWLAAFFFTQLIEVPIYVRGPRVRPAVAFGASLLTHPLLWVAVAHPSAPGTYLARVVVAELAACLIEALYLHLWGARRALLWSLLANAASLMFGLLSRAVFGVP
jgi:hypothetical protein